MQLNTVRRWLHAGAELLDVYRILPRVLVAGYTYLLWDVIQWYMALPEPTTQHAALVTTVVGAAAGFFGLYVNSGKKWSEGFTHWDDESCKECKEDDCKCEKAEQLNG